MEITVTINAKNLKDLLTQVRNLYLDLSKAETLQYRLDEAKKEGGSA